MDLHFQKEKNEEELPLLLLRAVRKGERTRPEGSLLFAKLLHPALELAKLLST
jgi:hypothetical protein